MNSSTRHVLAHVGRQGAWTCPWLATLSFFYNCESVQRHPWICLGGNPENQLYQNLERTRHGGTCLASQQAEGRGRCQPPVQSETLAQKRLFACLFKIKNCLLKARVAVVRVYFYIIKTASLSSLNIGPEYQNSTFNSWTALAFNRNLSTPLL